MKKSLLILMTLAMALCFAIMSFAAPGAVDVMDAVEAQPEENNSAELMADILGQAPEEAVTAKELMSVAARLHSTLNNGGLSQTYDFAAYNTYAEQNGIVGSGAYRCRRQHTDRTITHIFGQRCRNICVG